MDSKIYLLAKSLNESLNEDPNVLKLKSLEKELDDSYEVYSLSNKKDEALNLYLDLKNAFGENDDKVKEALLKLKAAKEELNNHPLVKEYLSVYSKVRDLYLEVDDILLGEFKKANC